MEDWRQLLRDILILVLGAISTFVVQRFRTPSQQAGDWLENQGRNIDNQGRALKTLSDAFDEIAELRELYRKSERLQKVQFTYILLLLEEYHAKGMTPPQPPKEIESDPEIIRLTKRHSQPKIKPADSEGGT